ncbi:MAG: hypothetical protein ACRDGR_01935, partial [bacterium]
GAEAPVVSLVARFDVVQEIQSGELHVIDTSATIHARTARGEEWMARSELRFVLGADQRGYLRVRELRENVVDPGSSWTDIRWRYSPRDDP